ncbi:hypothetical protein [Bradyrhizobium sp. SBR1B]|uniref:hypothetical protein n=1 Tax=Bradyrhizobium sp. SBR1B TaxID=2663836 RepID=UPI0016066AFD|nr:hypothetical protein [Bradyrhizobium sp. SBR1B]MBB4382962.1 hypothetical protein [Bradyrhizobium sp. SBR1B]
MSQRDPPAGTLRVGGSGFVRSDPGVVVYDLQLYFRAMNPEYDPEDEAVAAMRLAAETDGDERLTWIRTALAWSELTRLRAATRGAGRTEEAV